MPLSPAHRRFAAIAGVLALAALITVFVTRPAGTSPATSTPPPGSAPAPTTSPPAKTPAAKTPAAAGTTAAGTDVGDFRAALEAAQRLRDPRERSQAFGRALRRWLENDLNASLAYVRALPPGSLRTLGVLLSLDYLAQLDPARALNVAAELVASRDEQAFYSQFFARLAQQDLAAATQRLALVPAAGRENAVRAVTDAWAARDVTAALTWAQQLPEADRAFAVESALRTLAETDPLRAIQIARQSLTGAALDRTVAVALPKLIPEDPAAAAAIVTQMSPGETQTLAALGVARELAKRNPAEALAWITTLPAGLPQRLALNNALDGWAEHDLPTAGAHVAQMSAGAGQDAAADHFARLVAARDPAQAIAWAQGLTSGSARVAAFITIGSTWAQRDPVAAVQWAATLPDGAGQAGTVTGAFSYWQQRDPAAAQAWLAGANLPADVKARLKKSP